jgi:hypothetical protein
LSWRRLNSLILHLPPESACVAVTNPDRWDRDELLLAGIYDLLAAANWQRSGRKNSPKPKPLPRPGVNLPTKRFGNKSIPIDEWRRRRAARFPERGEHGRRARHGLHQPGPLSEGDREEPVP